MGTGLPNRSSFIVFPIVALLVANVLSEPDIVEASRRLNPEGWRQRKFSQYQGFVTYSGYRVSSRKFVSLGLADRDRHGHHNLTYCQWYSYEESTIMGAIDILYHRERQGGQISYSPYDTVVVTCTLQSSTDSSGGYLAALINDVEMVLYREEPGQIDVQSLQTKARFRHHLTICGPPIFNTIDPGTIWQWLEYHRVITGVDKFVLYDIMALDKNVTAVIRPYIESGHLEIVPVPGVPFSVWCYAKILLAQDCVYSTLWSTRWTMMLNVNEYMEAAPPYTLATLLRQYRHLPWLSHQAQLWNSSLCNNRRKKKYGIQRMVFREPEFYCEDEPCFSYRGLRKVIVNPRRVRLLGMNEVQVSRDRGIELDPLTELRHVMYGTGNSLCTEPVVGCIKELSDSETVEGFVRDYRIAKTVAIINKHPLGGVKVRG